MAADALSPEQAFAFDAIATGPATVLVRARAMPGYYLYREAFGFAVDAPDIDVVQADLPPGEAIIDESFGDTLVYFGEVEIRVHLARPAARRNDCMRPHQRARRAVGARWCHIVSRVVPAPRRPARQPGRPAATHESRAARR